MRNEVKKITSLRTKRAYRVRNKLRRVSEKPRLSVKKTNKNLFVQLIDDQKGITLCQASTISKDAKANGYSKKSMDSAKHLGVAIAKAALEKGVHQVAFDRGFYKYHGLVAQIAESARETGLQF